MKRSTTATTTTTTTTKSCQSCPTLCDPIDCSPPGSAIPGILQAKTLEWVAISFSNAWKEKWKWSRSVVSDSWRPHGLQPTRLLRPWDFPGESTGVGCHCLLQIVFVTHLYLLSRFPLISISSSLDVCCLTKKSIQSFKLKESEPLVALSLLNHVPCNWLKCSS